MGHLQLNRYDIRSHKRLISKKNFVLGLRAKLIPHCDGPVLAMSNLNNTLEPKCTRRQADINGKITNMLDSSEMPLVSPPRQRATRISSSPGVPEKNTNLVNSVQFANTAPAQSRRLSDVPLNPGEIAANVNAKRKSDDGDDGFECGNDSSNEDDLVEELRHLGKQQMAEMLQNKRRLEEKLEMMTQKNANKKPG